MRLSAEALHRDVRNYVEDLGEFLTRYISVWGSAEGTQEGSAYGVDAIGARRIEGKRGRSIIEIVSKPTDPEKDTKSVRFNLDREGRLHSFETTFVDRGIGEIVLDNLLPNAKHDALPMTRRRALKFRGAVAAEASVELVKSAGLMDFESAAA